MSSATGKCLCEQITVSVNKDVLNASETIALCHCKNCCRAGGSLGSISVIAPESAVKITGQPKIYHDSNTNSGKAIQRAFCGNCGSPIYSTSPNLPGSCIVKLGLFDEISKPSMEIYCKSLPSWQKPLEGIKNFDGMPTK